MTWHGYIHQMHSPFKHEKLCTHLSHLIQTDAGVALDIHGKITFAHSRDLVSYYPPLRYAVSPFLTSRLHSMLSQEVKFD